MVRTTAPSLAWAGSAAGHGLANLPEQTARAARGERNSGHGGGGGLP